MNVDRGVLENYFNKIDKLEALYAMDYALYSGIYFDILQNNRVDTRQKNQLIDHYLRIGQRRGYIKSFFDFYQRYPEFDWVHYLSVNNLKKVRKDERSAIIHYMREGLAANLSTYSTLKIPNLQAFKSNVILNVKNILLSGNSTSFPPPEILSVESLSANLATLANISANTIVADALHVRTLNGLAESISIIASNVITNAIRTDNINADAITTRSVDVGDVTADSISAGDITTDSITSTAINSGVLRANLTSLIHVDAETIAANTVISPGVLQGNVVRATSLVCSPTIQTDRAQVSALVANYSSVNSIECTDISIDDNLVTNKLYATQLESDNALIEDLAVKTLKCEGALELATGNITELTTSNITIDGALRSERIDVRVADVSHRLTAQCGIIHHKLTTNHADVKELLRTNTLECSDVKVGNTVRASTITCDTVTVANASVLTHLTVSGAITAFTMNIAETQNLQVGNSFITLNAGLPDVPQDCGLIVSRGGNNPAWLWKERGNSFVAAFTPSTELTSTDVPLDTLATFCSGKIGINTLEPTAALDVKGDLVIRDEHHTWTFKVLDEGKRLGLHYDGRLISTSLLDMTSFGTLDFTGQHRSTTLTPLSDYVGCIVRSCGTYKNLDGTTGPTMNEALPVVDLTRSARDRAVYGVVSSVEDEGEHRVYSRGNQESIIPKPASERRAIINAVGEGAIWVCNINGNIQNGDYITSSDVPGIGMKQDDDILHNYTVAKVTCDCTFGDDAITFQWKDINLKKALVGCTYHCG